MAHQGLQSQADFGVLWEERFESIIGHWIDAVKHFHSSIYLFST